jgi:hypothetical protein
MRTLRNTRHTLRKTLRKKRVTRKQSGGRVDMVKLRRVIAKRARAAEFAKTSAKMAQKLKDRIESF